MRWNPAAVSVLLGVCVASAARAVPAVDYFYPAGGQSGTTVQVTANGTFPAWPVSGWADVPGIHIEPGKDKGALSLKIDKDVPLGPHAIRLYGPDGTSAPRLFIVGDQSEIPEAEPNDEPRQAQRIATLPATINGQLEKPGDVDCYAVALGAGQTLVASVQGRRLGSPIDPQLHLLDAAGHELAFVHDGLGLDPLLAYRAPQSGTYVVRVSAIAYPPAADVHWVGGKGDVYRLSLATGPFPRGTLPAAISRGTKRSLSLYGYNIPDGVTVEADATNLPLGEDVLHVPLPGPESPLRIPVSDGEELLATDLHDRILTPPFGVTGRGTDAQPIRFTAKKGETFRLLARSAALGSALDPVLTVTDDAGKFVDSTVNGGTAGLAKLEGVAPADIVYRVTVTDLFHKASADDVWHLAVSRDKPHVTATVGDHQYVLTAGKSVAAKVTVARSGGHKGNLVVVATALPPGVTATTAEVPEKGGEVTVTLAAAPDAKPTAGPIRFAALGTDPAKPEAHAAWYVMGKEKDPPQELLDRLDAIWLTVLPPPPPTTAPAK